MLLTTSLLLRQFFLQSVVRQLYYPHLHKLKKHDQTDLPNKNGFGNPYPNRKNLSNAFGHCNNSMLQAGHLIEERNYKVALIGIPSAKIRQRQTAHICF